MTPSQHSLWEAVRGLAAVEAGGRLRTSEQAVALAKQLHEKLVLHLAPVVGDAGMDALFARSVRKTKPDFPSLSELETGGPPQKVLAQLYEHLQKQKVAELEKIIVALMVAFIRLLSTFIGEGLTWKLVRQAWPECLPNEFPSGETT